jgi:hypothetical protein
LAEAADALVALLLTEEAEWSYYDAEWRRYGLSSSSAKHIRM